MKIVLLKDVKNVGQAFDIVDVKAGFGRNYLIPKKLACLASAGKIREIENLKQHYTDKLNRERSLAQSLAQKLEGLALKASLKMGSKGKSFGSITAAEVAELLEGQGIKLSKKMLNYEWPIKEPGVYSVGVRLHPDISCQFKLWVGEE